MRKIRCNKKMTLEDVSLIVNELKLWEQGEMGTKLTWEKVEAFSGFTKPALHAKSEIKEAFQKAKDVLRGGGRKAVSRQKEEYAVYLENRIHSLTGELNQYKQLENSWLAKWQRMAYHLSVRGINIEAVDLPLPKVDRQ